jgi:8-oxo-dGTP pyrophosphatase MutT (NUDIX family)
VNEHWESIQRAIGQSSEGSSDFDLNKDVALAAGRKLRPAGVLIPLIETTQGIEVILTKRSSALKHHPGQIAFPGGKVEAGDVDTIAAALREAHEEIGLHPDNVEVMGTLPDHETVTKFTVVPVLGRLKAEFVATPQEGEVEEVFRVPLAHVTNIANFQIQSRHWLGSDRHYYVVPYGPYYIWGATARILRGLAGRMLT